MDFFEPSFDHVNAETFVNYEGLSDSVHIFFDQRLAVFFF